jgi:hypothetical protein
MSILKGPSHEIVSSPALANATPPLVLLTLKDCLRTHHSSAPRTNGQGFDVAYDIDDRRSICSEGLLQRAP